MTSLTIPVQWLIPKKFSNEWRFQCSTNLCNLVATNRAACYFRQLVTFLEDDQQLVDYHLKLRHNFERDNQLDIYVLFGDSNRKFNPSPTTICISCQPTHELSIASLLSEQQYTRAWLDGHARPKLILTPIRHVERLSELIDENGEMEAFWYDAVDLIDKECGQLRKYYPNMILNHGTYRNHPHLHLKINFIDKLWNRTIARRHNEKIKEIEGLLEQSTIVGDCFGQRQLEKMTSRRNDVKNNNS